MRERDTSKGVEVTGQLATLAKELITSAVQTLICGFKEELGIHCLAIVYLVALIRFVRVVLGTTVSLSGGYRIKLNGHGDEGVEGMRYRKRD